MFKRKIWDIVADPICQESLYVLKNTLLRTASLCKNQPHTTLFVIDSLNSERQESFLFLLVLSVSVAITSKTMQNF